MPPWFSLTSSGPHLRDWRLVLVALAAWLVCLAWLAVTAWRHRRAVSACPIRIHVAGTRGKSTTTRLIAAGLRAGGLRVLAKTTGSAPRLVLPDGRDEVWPRRGPASVHEQTRFFARAARLGVDVAVVECMAIQPELIWASQAHLVRATTAVLTNARPDHAEELGSDPAAMAEALRFVVPDGGVLVVAAEAADAGLRRQAEALGCILDIVPTDGLVPNAANRALALAVCAHHGVEAAVAGPAMDAMTGDPGGFFEAAVRVDGKCLRFACAFACNDVASLQMHWYADAAGTAVLLNARPDRPLRTRQFLTFLAGLQPVPKLFICGDRLALRLARRMGFADGSVVWLAARTAAPALRELAANCDADGLIWGIGNHHGLGAGLALELNRAGAAC